jgi:hypothetical protein
MTYGMILKALGKTKDDGSLSPSELEKLIQQLNEIIADTSITAPKEIEAYLFLDTGYTYEGLAELIEKREQKHPSKEEHEKLLGILRARACRGRQKVLKKLRQINQTQKKDSERFPS